MVNLGQLQSIQQLDSGDTRLYLKGGAVVPCSRRYRDALRAQLGQGRPAAVS